MKFKSLIFGLIIAGTSVSAFAQMGEVITAKEALTKYIQMARSSSKLAAPFMKEAQDALEKAKVHKRTLDNPDVWSMRSLLYSEMAFNDSTAASANYAKEAQASIAKTKELDPQADARDDIKKAKLRLYQNQLSKGKKLFDNKNFESAYTAFNSGLEYMPSDTLLNYFAGVSAQNTKNYKAAIKNYSDLLNTNFSFLVDVYTNLGESYAASKDTASAIKTLAEGSAKFPNSNLSAREIELSINSGRYKEILPKIEDKVKNNPTNKYYPFYLGIAYANLNEPAKAEEAYQKAITIDANFLEAYLNLASVIMNAGIDTYNNANKKYANKALKPAELAEYNAIKKKATVDFDRALPFLTKAIELNPKSVSALNGLRTYYLAKSNKAKVAELDAQIKTLQ